MKWKSVCYDVRRLRKPQDVLLADNQTAVLATHRGTLAYTVNGLQIILRGVYLVDGLPDSLVSQSHVLRCMPGWEYLVRDGKMSLRRDGIEYPIGVEVQHLYFLYRGTFGVPHFESAPAHDGSESRLASAPSGYANISPRRRICLRHFSGSHQGNTLGLC
jgi:hypothetical protein